MLTIEMVKIRIISWNVNGMRAILKKGFLEWVKKENPDILCLQEIKATPEQLHKPLELQDYHVYWSPAERKGYSGVATFTKEKPIKVEKGFGIPRFDKEGRTLVTEFKEFILFNVYFPNGKMGEERLKYKLDFYEAFLKHVDMLKARGKKIIVTGDYNTAHKEIDIARPKENENASGFLSIERAWMDKLVSHGYTDTFRHFNKLPGQFF